jgi:peptidoglycan L-alanyl-D-glutamate endopeptidase CwlK
MIDSRALSALNPIVEAKARALIAAAKAEGITLTVTSTYRDAEAQDALYARGRGGNPGPRVTNARAGQSLHNYRVAFDVAPLRAGKPIWTTSGADGKLWQRIGELGEAQGLEWGGRWERFPDLPHFQYTGGLTLADFQTGKRP